MPRAIEGCEKQSCFCCFVLSAQLASAGMHSVLVLHLLNLLSCGVPFWPHSFVFFVFCVGTWPLLAVGESVVHECRNVCVASVCGCAGMQGHRCLPHGQMGRTERLSLPLPLRCSLAKDVFPAYIWPCASLVDKCLGGARVPSLCLHTFPHRWLRNGCCGMPLY